MYDGRFRLVDDSLARRLDNDFKGENAPSAVLFAGNRNTSRLTESYYLSKLVSGGSKGAVRFYPVRNMRSYMEFGYDCFERSRTAFAAESLVRAFDICFNSPNILESGPVSEIYYSFLEFKDELSKGDRNNARIGKLAKSIKDFFVSRIHAAGITVDDAKDVIGFLSQSLPNSKSRCVVIENLESANVSVCNALLKTLEEPSDRSVIILISDRPSALLKTILSRVIRYNFLPAKDDKVKTMLRLSGSPYAETEYEDAIVYGDGEHLQEIRGAAKDLFGYVKSHSPDGRKKMFDMISPLLKKGYSTILSPVDVASVILIELSRTAESDFLAKGRYSSFHSSLSKRIRKAIEDLKVYNIFPQNVIEMVMM
ncbi:MAG TPA: hypothetical protein DCO86_05385 [Spirochaetaceae bacterium]|nr:hypothetical protein [Spirochaetaceae bacterium]